ncbi:MAG: hypothetical protein ACPLW7_05370, partial [Minisyncoccia bacterium]
TIRIMKDGYNEFSKKIDITNGKTTDLRLINLDPIKVSFTFPTKIDNIEIKFEKTNSEVKNSYEYKLKDLRDKSYPETNYNLNILFVDKETKKKFCKLTIPLNDIKKDITIPLCYLKYEDNKTKFFIDKFEIDKWKNGNYKLENGNFNLNKEGDCYYTDNKISLIKYYIPNQDKEIEITLDYLDD